MEENMMKMKGDGGDGRGEASGRVGLEQVRSRFFRGTRTKDTLYSGWLIVMAGWSRDTFGRELVKITKEARVILMMR